MRNGLARVGWEDGYGYINKLLPAGFGDRVRIRPAAETEMLGIAGRSGIVYGITTVSVTGVDVIGTPTEDVAREPGSSPCGRFPRGSGLPGYGTGFENGCGVS